MAAERERDEARRIAAKDWNETVAADKARAIQAELRAEAAEALAERRAEGLRVALPYVKDALEQGGMTNEIEAVIREDIETVRAALADEGQG